MSLLYSQLRKVVFSLSFWSETYFKFNNVDGKINLRKKCAEIVDWLTTKGTIILCNSYLCKFEFRYAQMAVLKLPI